VALVGVDVEELERLRADFAARKIVAGEGKADHARETAGKQSDRQEMQKRPRQSRRMYRHAKEDSDALPMG
jgi:hypothetical protein